MEEEESIGSPMSETIATQIKNREAYFGTNNRGRNTLTLANGQSAFAILRSSVNTGASQGKGGSSSLASEYVLGMNLKGGLSKGSNTTRAYNPSPTSGLRPFPGITSVSVQSMNTMGTLLLATVNFKVYSKEDLDAVEQVYFRPGFTALLEFGHTTYVDSGDVDNKTSIKTMTSGVLVKDFFGKKSVDDIEKSIAASVKSTEHNYEGLFGFIQNFQWSLAADGSYDCSIKLVTKNAVVESIKTPPASARVTSKEMVVDTDTPVTGYKDILSFLFERLEREESKAIFNGTEFLSNTSNTGGNVASLATALERFFVARTSIQIGGTGWFGFFQDKLNLCYIRLADFLDMINKFVLIKDSSGTPVTQFYTGDQEKFNTHASHTSANPLVCVPPKVPTGSERYIKRSDLHKWMEKQAGSYGGTDNILNIFVTTHYLKQCLAATIDGPQEPGTGIYDTLTRVLAGMQDSLGGINNFMIYFDGKKNRIVDSGNKRAKKAEVPTIQISGPRTTVYNVSIVSKISNDLSSQIAISAGGSTESYGENNANMLEFNAGKADRHIGGALVTPNKSESASENNTELQKKVDDVWKEFNGENEFDATTWDQLKNENTAYNIAKFNKEQKSSQDKLTGSAPMPIEISLEMMGIGGVKYSTVFKVPNKLLPNGYDDYGFTITGINHSIGTDHKWRTSLNGLMYRLK